MSWPTHFNFVPESLYPWSGTEPEDWRANFVKGSGDFPMSPSPDPSITAPNVPLITGSRPYDQLHLPLGPVPFEGISSPALSSTSSAYFEHNLNEYRNERSQSPASVGIGIELSPTTFYDPRRPSRWADVKLSPVPSLRHPSSNTIPRSINENIPASTPIQETCDALTPASLDDPGVSSPQTDGPPSTVSAERALSSSEAGQSPSPSKQPCLPRGCTSKKRTKDYGTYKCDYKDCTYDRMFSRKGVLMRHIQTQHINPRGFKCPVCPHASGRKENMKAHRQAVHGEIL